MPTHYHGFGVNTGNNNGTFGATSDADWVSYTMPAVGGTRSWNGSGGGGSFNGLVATYKANLITSLAKIESGSLQPAALKVSVLIKHD